MNSELIKDLVTISADFSPDAIFLVNEQGRIRHVSPACEDIFGYVPGDFVDQFIIDFVVPADQDATRKEAKEVLAGRKRNQFARLPDKVYAGGRAMNSSVLSPVRPGSFFRHLA